MRQLIAPHGGTLIQRYLPANQVADIEALYRDQPGIDLGADELLDVAMLASGAYSPLEGFMNEADYLAVVERMRLQSGRAWSLPITLAASEEEAGRFEPGDTVPLKSSEGDLVAVLELEQIYRPNVKREAQAVYLTDEEAHPGVARLYARPPMRLGGAIRALRPRVMQEYADFWLEPKEARYLFSKLGHRRVVGFQTRNPLHRAHEYLIKCALETADAVLLHPLVGTTKADDIPAEVRMECYERLLSDYFPEKRTVLSVFPAPMRYAGPREAIFHALVRQNYGCSHFIVGRDHAGVGSYYGTYDAQHIFDEFEPGEIGITPLFYDYAFHCERCDGMATTRTCPHPDDHRTSLAGRKVRALLARGELPSPRMTRPEVARILAAASKATAGPA